MYSKYVQIHFLYQLIIPSRLNPLWLSTHHITPANLLLFIPEILNFS
jgi:hypothetical protein